MVAGCSVSDHPRPLAEWCVDPRSHLSRQEATSPNALILVERREFIRGCLTCWLERHCGEITPVPAADVESALQQDVLSRSVVAAIIGLEPSEQHDWLCGQIALLRARHGRLPIMLFVDSDQIATAAELTEQLDLQGYIPPFSSLEVAAAAVRLIIAGGTYFPRRQSDARRQNELPPGHEPLTTGFARIAELTARERAVLGLLGSGTPNKVIAHRLGMSLSTVKAHVHHIIRKLKVGNRTEVALLIQHLYLGAVAPSEATPAPVLPAPSSRSGATIGGSQAPVDSHAGDIS